MNEPLRRSISQHEAIKEAREYMAKRYGALNMWDKAKQDDYFEKLGVLVDFVSTIIPSENPHVDV